MTGARPARSAGATAILARGAAALGVATLGVAGLAGCEREPPPAPPERVRQDFHLNAYEKDLGYSQAVLIDKTLFVSGTVAADADGRLIAPNDMAAQMRAVYGNIKRTLAANGVGFDSVVKETIYTTDMDALLKVADLRFEYYAKERLPAVSWVEVRRLLDPGFLVEVEVVAELP
jgi:enamine deaminase RidA (YjgF/YER057c/UK114 family)